MKTLLIRTFILLAGLSPAYSIIAADDSNPADSSTQIATPRGVFNSDMEKLSYFFGHQIGDSFQKQGFDINVDILMLGIKEAMDAKPSLVSKEEAQTIMMKMRDTIMKKQKELMDKKKLEDEKKLGQDNMWKISLEKPEMITFNADTDYYWILETNKGIIRIKLMPDVAPMHVTSTIFLTKKGFYDDLLFHRVIPGFMAQGGCPLGTGTSGPGYKYDGEFRDDVKFDRPYLLAMANAGPGTDGSQFFITFVPTKHLNGLHTIFGEVTEGQDVMKKLEEAGSPSGKTTEELKIIKATIEEKKK